MLRFFLFSTMVMFTVPLLRPLYRSLDEVQRWESEDEAPRGAT